MTDSNGWMPIETAPKDGTVIDLWVIHPDRKGGGYRCANAASKRDAWREPNGFPVEAFFNNTTGIPLIRASNWMPLPTPPKGEA